MTVDFEQLGATEEYQALKGLESVLLYDTVTVLNDEIGLSLQLYVSELEWDAIRQKVTGLKLVNAMTYSKGNVTGYNVQSKSIGSDKLTDDVSNGILEQVRDIIPEYSDPQASRPATVTVNDGDPTLAWGTRSKVGDVQGTDLHVTMPSNPAANIGQVYSDSTYREVATGTFVEACSVTVPAGTYIVVCTACWQANANGYRIVGIEATTDANRGKILTSKPTGAPYDFYSLPIIMQLSQQTIIKEYVYQTSGSKLQQWPLLSAIRIA